MSTTANVIKAHYEIPVMLQDGGAIPHIPAVLKFGDTVHYKSKDGEVTMEFLDNGSPYLDLNGNQVTTVTSNDPPLELKVRGVFTSRCFITPPGGTPIGWSAEYPESGGNHDVR